MDCKVNSITLVEPNEPKTMLRRDLNEKNRMSWNLALLCADVLGVDISDTALAIAQEMSVNGGRDAWFEMGQDIPAIILGENNRYCPPEHIPNLQMMFGLSARMI